jgi:hypothetical protein
MAAPIASATISLKPPDIFRHYDGPPKPNRGRKRDRAPRRKVDLSPDVLFTDIDDLVRGDLAGPGLVPEFGGDAVEGGSRGTCELAMQHIVQAA